MQRNEKTGNKVLRVVERIARNEAAKSKSGYPPICLGIGHQPKRPKQSKN